MGVTANDIKFLYTKNPDVTVPSGNTSLGHSVSNVEVSTSLEGLFSNVDNYESLTGSVEYRCVAIKNVNTEEPLTNTNVFISNDTIGDDNILIAVETPINDVVQEIQNINTSPIGLNFIHADINNAITCTSENSVSGNLDPGKWVALWIKRIVPAGARATTENSFSIQITGNILIEAE